MHDEYYGQLTNSSWEHASSCYSSSQRCLLLLYLLGKSSFNFNLQEMHFICVNVLSTKAVLTRHLILHNGAILHN